MNRRISIYGQALDLPAEKQLVIVNYLKGKIDIYEGYAREKVLAYLEGNPVEECVLDCLFNSGYLVDSNIDETQELKCLKEQIINQEETLLLIIYVTEKCNFRCVYCCEEYQLSSLDPSVQDDVLLFIEIALDKHRHLQIEWFGGEPLLHPEIIINMSTRILDICKEKKVSYTANITTNGYFLSPELLITLTKLHVISYQITIDGMSSTHDQQRMLCDGRGTWDKIIGNLRGIRDQVKTNLFNIMIRTNITYPIYQQHHEYIDFLKREFNSDKRFHFVWKLAEDWGNIEDRDKEILCGPEEYMTVVKLANKYNLRNRFISKSLIPGGRICETSKKNSLVIFPDGKVGKCARKVCPDQSIIGTVKDLIQKPKIYTSIVLTNQIDNERCTSCKMAPLCLGSSCPFTKKCLCGYELDHIDFLLESIAKTDDICKHISIL